jgi:hypothetical protein
MEREGAREAWTRVANTSKLGLRTISDHHTRNWFGSVVVEVPGGAAHTVDLTRSQDFVARLKWFCLGALVRIGDETEIPTLKMTDIQLVMQRRERAL